MDNKTQILSEIKNESFMKQLYFRLLMKPRYDFCTNKELVKRISRMLTKEQARSVRDMYLMGYSPEKIRRRLKIFQEDEHLERLAESITSNIKSLEKAKMGFQVRFMDRICDIVAVSSKNVYAFEIKTSRDKIKDAVDQCVFYKKWADKSYIVAHEKHKKSVLREPEFTSNGIGIMFFDNSHNLKIIKYAKSTKHDKETLIETMGTAYKREICRKFKFPIRGKDEMKNMLMNVSKPILEKEFRSLLDRKLTLAV